MIFRCHRETFTDHGTLSRVSVLYSDGRRAQGGAPFAVCVEDRDRGLSMYDSLDHIARVKVPGQTAIPVGFYRVALTHSPKFSQPKYARMMARIGCSDGRLPLLLDVPGFRGVRIHPGNRPSESLSCPFLGRALAVDFFGVVDSTPYVRWACDQIRSCERRGEPVFWHTDRDPAAWLAYREAA